MDLKTKNLVREKERNELQKTELKTKYSEEDGLRRSHHPCYRHEDLPSTFLQGRNRVRVEVHQTSSRDVDQSVDSRHITDLSVAGKGKGSVRQTGV